MIKNNKIIVSLIAIVFILIIVSAIVTFSNSRHHSRKNTSYSEIIKKIDSKKSFNILITDKDTAYLKPVLNHYKSSYNIEVEYLNLNPKDEKFEDFFKRTSIKFIDSFKSLFIVIKDGEVIGSLVGEFNETNIKDLLIENNVIDKEYQNIDTVITKNIKNHIDGEYTILYVNKDDKEQYKYRELFVKNKIKSVVIYSGTTDASELMSLNKELGYENNIDEKLPAVIKTRNGKIEYVKTNVTLDNLIESTK